MAHRVTVEGPLSHPGGKNGFYRAVCADCPYMSAVGTKPRATKAGSDHVKGKG